MPQEVNTTLEQWLQRLKVVLGILIVNEDSKGKRIRSLKLTKTVDIPLPEKGLLNSKYT